MNKSIFLIFLALLPSVIIAQTATDQTFHLAQSFEQAGEFERAADMYESLFGKDSLNYTFFDGLRRCYVQLKRYDDALKISNNRYTKTPFDFNLQANIGSILYMAGRERQSDSVWNTIILSANKNQMFYRAVANEQASQRLFDKATSTFQSGRREVGDPFLFANELGYYYSFMMDYTNATKEYILLLKQNEQQFDFIQSRLAQYTIKPDGLKATLSVLEEEVQNDPNAKHPSDKISLYRLLLWVYLEGTRFADAFLIAKVIEQKINSNGAELFSFAERVFRERAYDVAATAYQSALKNGSQMQFAPMASFGYARCVEELSARGDSVNMPKNVPQQSLLETQPTFNAAVILYESIAQKYPYSNVGANALYRIGWIRYKQLFDLDGALHIFDSVLVVSPTGSIVPIVLSTMGEIYTAKGRLNEATKKYVAMAVSSYSTPVQQTYAQYRLAEMQYFQNNFDSTVAILGRVTQNLKADESNDALMLQYFISENKTTATEALTRFAKGEFLARQYKVSEAITELQSIVQNFKSAPLCDDALIKIAEYSLVLKRYSDVLNAYQQLLKDFPKSIEIEKTQFKIAELYQLYLKDKEKAISWYEVILEKNPFSLFAEESRKRIRQLRGDNL